jgi:5-methyltetrahydrofolate--homocysteine methyltransferase
MNARLEKFIGRLSTGRMALADGGWDARMAALGLGRGACPEAWNVSRPQAVRQIAGEYIAAGAEALQTNTFGANKFRLQRYGLADRAREFNRAGAALCREAAEKSGAVVAASVGPTGEYVQPHGPLPPEQVFEAFREQMAALKEGGADAVCIETMPVLEEALLAVKAARALGLFCIASMTFDAAPDGYRTVLGTPLEEAIRALDTAGADMVGSNCGCGMAQMARLAPRMALFTKKPLWVKANAGQPELVDGGVVYRETPQKMAARVAELRASGIAVIGGCCGTTPEHIRAMRAALG